MSRVEVRELRVEDSGRCAEIWSDAMSGAYRRSRLDAAEFEKITFGNQNFDSEASFVADKENEVVAFTASYCQKFLENDGYWHVAAPGWIGALAVGKAERGRGIGSRLLEAAEDTHRKKGRLLLLVGGGENAGNFICGLEEGWADAASFFMGRDYRCVRRTCFVNIDLEKYEIPERVKAGSARLEGEGFSFVQTRGGEDGGFGSFYRELGYSDAAVSGLLQRSGECIAVKYKGRIVGLLGNIHIENRRAGYSGITTLPEFRRKGIGKVMLAMAVDYAKSQGASSMPLWTRPATYEKFYSGLGFYLDKNYDVYAKMLPQNLLSVDWIARYQDPR